MFHFGERGISRLDKPEFFFLIKFMGNSLETDIITIRELAAYLKMAEKTLYRLAAEGCVA